MNWRTTLNEEIQQMKHNNNSSRYAGGWGYTPANIEDCARENKRIDKYAKDQIEKFYKIEVKELEEKAESKNKYLKDILLALPYIKEDIQSILDKHPPVFQLKTGEVLKYIGYLTNCPDVSSVKSSISTHMLTELYDAFVKCLTSIKSNIPSQDDIDCADRIYNKSTVLEGHNKTSCDNVISRAQSLHYIYQATYIVELLIEKGIRHEYIDKPLIRQPLVTELYMKIGTKYLHLFIDSEIDTHVNNIIFPQNYGQWTKKEIHGLNHSAIHHIRTTTRINQLSELELKRQEQELIHAEVERLLKKEDFEKQVLVKLQEKKKFQREERARINAQRDYEKDVLKKNKKRSPEIQRRAVSIVKPMVKPMVKPIAKPLDKAISKLSSQVIELKHVIPHYFNLMEEEIQRDEINDYLKDIRKYDKYIQI